MATHNDGPWLQEAVESICSSTYPVDLYVVDDSSNPPAKISTPVGSSVTLMRLDQNVGLTRALNQGLQHILPLGYDYIGRMDADDISYPDRFARQVQFLQENKTIAGVGCWANFIDAATKQVKFRCTPPTDDKLVRRALSFNNCVLHPTWLMRANTFGQLEGYDASFVVAQDYEFLVRASALGFKFSNIPRVLIDYRISPNGISVSKRRRQIVSRWKVQARHFRPLSFDSWLGLIKTAVLFATPAYLVRLLKSGRALS